MTIIIAVCDSKYLFWGCFNIEPWFDDESFRFLFSKI